MITKTLGRTGLEVTQLGFGAMEIRGPRTWKGREVTDEQADAILNAVLDAGINFIDTAVDYGLSEERIGRFISSRREEYFLATKCGCDPKDVGDHIDTPHTWTRDNLLRNISGSLERMKTDRVDILQLHNPTVEAVRENGLVEALNEIRDQKATRFIGISTTLPHLPEFAQMGVFDTFQIPYSCLQPAHHDSITLAAQSAAGVIVRGGIAQGDWEGAVAPGERKSVWESAHLDDLCDGIDPSELILRYTLSHPHCHTTIVGTLDPDHLGANVAAAEKGPLEKDLYDEITRRVAEAAQKS